MKRATFTFAVLCGLALLVVAALMPAPGGGTTHVPAALSQPVLAADVGFSVLPDGRGGTNVESVLYTEAMGFDKMRSLDAFKNTVYPLLRANCSGCHSTARWAPRVVNPVDVNGKGIVYRFDIRDYWGYTLIDTSDPDFTLFYGGSDDDLAFASSKLDLLDLNGKPIKYASLAEMVHKLKPEVTRDEEFARLAWARILKGNAEGADEGQSLPPNIDGFFGTRKVGPERAGVRRARQPSLRRSVATVLHADSPGCVQRHHGDSGVFPRARKRAGRRQERLRRADDLEDRMGS